jgi:hypothetical protein
MKFGNALIWTLIAAGIAAGIIGLTVVIKSRTAPERVVMPARTADTACHMDLEALGRTLPYVPMVFHERIAAHWALRQAYAEPDDQRCRQIGGGIVRRFVLRNVHGERL